MCFVRRRSVRRRGRCSGTTRRPSPSSHTPRSRSRHSWYDTPQYSKQTETRIHRQSADTRIPAPTSLPASPHLSYHCVSPSIQSHSRSSRRSWRPRVPSCSSSRAPSSPSRNSTPPATPAPPRTRPSRPPPPPAHAPPLLPSSPPPPDSSRPQPPWIPVTPCRRRPL